MLRMEDIDPDRSRPEFAEGIMEDLAWLGITWDEGPQGEGREERGSHGPYVQSARFDRYAALLKDLEARGLIYPCYCTRKELRLLASAPHIGDEGAPYTGTCRNLSAAARARMEASGRKACLRLDTQAALTALGLSQTSIFFHDAVLGPQCLSLDGCGGDFALRRSDGVFAYQLAVSVDDAAMGITQVVRGEDLLSSTPRQRLLLFLMGAHPPTYAHLPLVHDAQGERLAKRHKALEITALRRAGIRPEAIIGYLGFLAGCRAQPEAARPEALLPEFALSSLKGRRLELPQNIMDVLHSSLII